MMQNLDARLRSILSSTLYNISSLQVACSLAIGPSTAMPCMHTNLASQRVKGNTRMHIAWQLNIYILNSS